MEPLTSMDFYYQKSRGFLITIIVITMIVVVILVLYLGIYLISRVPKACSQAPPPPQNVGAGYIDDNSFRVQWSSVSTADRYIVYVGQNQTFTRAQSINTTSTSRSQTEVDIQGLEPGRTYYILVSAVNTCGESEVSDRITFVYVQS